MKWVRGSRTSHWAAEGIEPGAGTLRATVYAKLREFSGGLTDHQMQQMLGMNPSTQRPRRIELCESGLVMDSGRTRPTPSGRKAVVWIALRPKPVQLVIGGLWPPSSQPDEEEID